VDQNNVEGAVVSHRPGIVARRVRPCHNLGVLGRRGLLALLLAAAVAAPVAADDRLAAVAAAVPRIVAGLEQQGTDERYGPEAIFSYLDGGAEVYLAYNLRGCLARHYAAPGLEVIADLFEMATTADAFGVFTHDQDGEQVAIGQGALLRPGWLSFWQERFFISLSADRDDARAREALLALGRAIAAAIPGRGAPPELVRRLPVEGQQPRSLRFLHDAVILRTHLDLGPGNPLALGPGVDAALARYRRAGSEAALVLVRYATTEAAGTAAAGARAALLGGSPRAARDARGGWRALAGAGREVAVVVDAGSEALAGELLAQALPAPKPEARP
jgi:hypothetical protein